MILINLYNILFNLAYKCLEDNKKSADFALQIVKVSLFGYTIVYGIDNIKF